MPAWRGDAEGGFKTRLNAEDAEFRILDGGVTAPAARRLPRAGESSVSDCSVEDLADASCSNELSKNEAEADPPKSGDRAGWAAEAEGSGGGRLAGCDCGGAESDPLA